MRGCASHELGRVPRWSPSGRALVSAHRIAVFGGELLLVRAGARAFAAS